MKLLKKVFKIIGFTFFILAIFLVGFFWSLKPKYDGEIKLKEISQSVNVSFDALGVPHIYAENEKDAYKALGYLHAQDRLWQMELIRRIVPGRLSEIFGKELVPLDKLFVGLGIKEASERTIRNLDVNTKSYQLTAAYLDGVNQFIEKGATPIEFYLLGIEKEKYTINDVFNVFGYMAFSFAVAHKTDPMLTEIKENLGEAYFRELVDAEYQNLTIIRNHRAKSLKESYANTIHEILEKLPISPFTGSNSWVIGGEKTKSGKVIFANDPHIGLAQPSVWYQAHIKTPDYEMYGFNLALIPFPLLGHNRQYAYGLTMFENDDIDFYYEENNPENDAEYKTVSGYASYEIRKETIRVKNDQDTTIHVKESKHGPIMNGIVDFIKKERPVAMQWIYTRHKNELLDVAYSLSHATNLEDFKKGASKIHAPGLNIMYGDADNNIAWFAAGKLYKYRDSLYTKVILDGASGRDEIQRFLDFEENPQAINPKWHYVYSANNQPDSVEGTLYPGYYLPEDRARRIKQLLESGDKFTKQDVAKMIVDVTSDTAPEIISYFIQNIEKSKLPPSEKKALQLLGNWNGTYGKEEVGPVIYSRLWYEFSKNTFEDEMGSVFKQFMNTPFEEKAIASQVKRVKSIWWDDVSTQGIIESKQDIMQKSFENTVRFLKEQLGENVDHWQWSRVASVEHEHAIGKAGGILRKIFNVGPFQTDGGDQVINNHIYNIDSTGYYKVHTGPSSRRVIDFSDIDNSLAVIPTGQSGNVFSPHYKDQAQKYLNKEFVQMKLKRQQIEVENKQLIFIPD